MNQDSWPIWWDWELEFSPHVRKRMLDRDFSETDVRRMLSDATDLHPAVDEGRWVATTRFRRRQWKVVVEPDFESTVLVVVTAFAVDS